jgi:hypothetical protein
MTAVSPGRFAYRVHRDIDFGHGFRHTLKAEFGPVAAGHQ